MVLLDVADACERDVCRVIRVVDGMELLLLALRMVEVFVCRIRGAGGCFCFGLRGRFNPSVLVLIGKG